MGNYTYYLKLNSCISAFFQLGSRLNTAGGGGAELFCVPFVFSTGVEGEENHELANSPFLSLPQWAGNHTLASLSVGSTEVRNVQSHKIQDSAYQIIPCNIKYMVNVQ